MEGKFFKRSRRAIVLCVMCAGLRGAALASETLIPVGQAVGIEITLAGVLVAGVGEVETAAGPASPAREAGLRPGDVITAVDGAAVNSAAELAEAVMDRGADPAELTVTRNGRPMSVAVTPVPEADGSPRLGLWLRDGVTGIGTVTYIDPETGAFGALGHGVNDAQSGALLPVEGGSLCRAQIVDVRPGAAGDPGELSGSFSAADAVGTIRENTDHGVFGVVDGRFSALREALPVADPAEVVPGPATILACVSGGEVREYRVEIARSGALSGAGRDLTVHVTDPELLALTGGIVQGMSGSPILQNGKLVGAVTHVLTGDPTRGYGIYAENMLAAAEAA